MAVTDRPDPVPGMHSDRDVVAFPAASTDAVGDIGITHSDLKPSDILFTSRVSNLPHLSTRQCAKIVHRWVEEGTPPREAAWRQWSG